MIDLMLERAGQEPGGLEIKRHSLVIEALAADAGRAHALVVAGMHMLEPLPPVAREAQLRGVAAALAAMHG